jgi:hypothetical protein
MNRRSGTETRSAHWLQRGIVDNERKLDRVHLKQDEGYCKLL